LEITIIFYCFNPVFFVFRYFFSQFDLLVMALVTCVSNSKMK
jgi:hypothetical protein